ncbi:hypothetical protein [Aggregatilinea lenta]|uniref:hypothetical protein n=1 Tax=Aggregatilinea lenta TaxID=913108 RepID=UPI000E5B5416|nr:hypothetical protein [Aggregatilinea lenta]
MGTRDQKSGDRDLEHTNEPSREDLESLRDPERFAARRARSDVREWDEQEAEYEEEAPQLEVIGPEDEDPEVIEENLEEYGYDLMDNDEIVSVPSAGPTPGWESDTGVDEDDPNDRLRGMANDSEGERPVEDEAIADLDGDLPPEREAPEI